MKKKTLILSVLFTIIGLFWFLSNLLPEFDNIELGEDDD